APEGRIYFTKFHEIGHIYLNHFIDFDETILARSKLKEKDYKILEHEANCFARNVLCPAPLVKHLKLNTPEKISSYFNITIPAAETRLGLLKCDLKHINSNVYDLVIYMFNDFINKRVCLKCKSSIQDSSYKFCNVCGHNRLIWGDGTVKYKSLDLNKLNKTTNCPTCGNEETDIPGEYCQICGDNITNSCSNESGNCTNYYLNGNSRYCPFCGSKSTFLINDILKEWAYESFLDEENEDEDNMPF
ncbi:MAG: ImmA/IrrE family metallo-endopeptidase, partial [Filifactoraceae bacterium]